MDSDSQIQSLQEVVVAERSNFVVAALRKLFEDGGLYHVSAHVRRPVDLYQYLRLNLPDFLLLGATLDGADASEVIAHVKKQGFLVRIILFADKEDTVVVQEAIRLGVQGICYQFEEPDVLLTTLRAVARAECACRIWR